MNQEDQMAALVDAIKTAGNDEVRYAVADRLRELGYVDVTDFATANPPAEHIAQIEILVRK